jgi:hypothetical protein
VPVSRLLIPDASGGRSVSLFASMALTAGDPVPFAKGDWRVELLGQIVLRCGAKPTTVTGVLCSSVGLAGIDSLALIGDGHALAQLDQLLGEVTNAGMVRKIAKAVGATDERLSVELMRLKTQKRPTIDRPWLGRWS